MLTSLRGCAPPAGSGYIEYVVLNFNIPQKMANDTVPNYLQPPSIQADNFLLFVYIINIIVGIPGNIFALCFFQTQVSDLPTLLYLVTAVNDITLILTTLPNIVSLSHQRKPMWFGNRNFCHVTGMLGTILPAFSVAIVGTLCVSRTVQLFLMTRKVNKKFILFLLFFYFTYLVTSEVVPVLASDFVFFYTSTEIYCWDSTNSSKGKNIDIGMDMIMFAIPVVPILLCCVVSTVKIWMTRKLACASNDINALKSRATTTILIFTLVYIIFNIPIFLVQVLRVALIFQNEPYPGKYFSNYFMYQYGWHVAKTLLPACNAAINPVIYFARIARYRVWLIRKIGRDVSSFVSKGAGPNFNKDTSKSNEIIETSREDIPVVIVNCSRENIFDSTDM